MPATIARILGLLSLLLFGLLSLWGLWQLQLGPFASQPQMLAPMNCQISQQGQRQQCSLTLPSGERLELGRDGELRSLALQQLWLTSSATIEQVQVVMEGRDMYVGRLHYPLQPHDRLGWAGRGAVGSCLDEEMPWRVRFQFRHQGQDYEVPLEFTIYQRPR